MKASSFAYNGRLEVRFPAKPTTQDRGVLKDRGFWWDGPAGCWWLARPVGVRFVRNEPVVQDGFDYALRGCQDYFGLAPEQAAQLKRQYEGHAQQRGDAAMEEACGIS